MRQSGLILGLLLPALAGLGGCGNSSDGTGGNGGGGGASGACGLAELENGEFCAAQAGEMNCDLVSAVHKHDACGVPLKAPPGDLARSENVEEFGGKGAPDLSCFDPATFPAKPGTPQTVTMKGKAVIFSHGCESKNLDIAVHKVKRTGGADDGDIGELVGSAIKTPDDCTIDGVPSEEEDCDPARYECVFEYPGVPTETELVIKTGGNLWASLYDYNIFIRNDEVKDGVWEHDVRALASDDYGVISQAAIGAPITPGHGAVAGEVHDCGDVRVVNAVVEVSVPRKALTYFGNDEAHPLPDLSGTGTSTLGLYAAIDVNPGTVTIAAAGQPKGGPVTGMGFLRVRVFPDAVTTVTFRGMNPVLVP